MNVKNNDQDIKLKCPYQRALVMVFIIIALMLFACKSSTEPKLVKMSGKVVFENDSDDPTLDNTGLEGIKVSLFKTVELDTTFIRLRYLYPILGTTIDQRTVFNTQLEVPFKSTLTNEEGVYEFKNISPGSYHLLFEKEGWGKVVKHNINTNSAKHNFSESLANNPASQRRTPTVLYPLVHVPSIVNQNYVFKENHTYIVSQDASFLAPVSFEGKSRIELAANSNISFMQNIEYMHDGNDYVTFTTINNAHNSSKPLWGAIRSYKEDQTIKNWIIEGSSGGIILEGNRSKAQDCIFRNSDTGINAQAETTEIKNCIFDSIESRAVYYNQVQGSETIKHKLINCIFKSCQEGLRTQGQAVIISNNYFVGNENALFSFTGFHIIKNNAFDRNTNALIINGSQISIEHNEFYNNKNSVLFSSAYYSGVSKPQFASNNFFQKSDYAFRIGAQNLQEDINAKNNYWLATDIDAIIYDAKDAPSLIYEIIYLPKKPQRVPNAGITNSS